MTDFSAKRQECVDWIIDQLYYSDHIAVFDGCGQLSRNIMDHCFAVALDLLKGSPLLTDYAINQLKGLSSEEADTHNV